jgi:DNA-binding MarR family transcriptional regulator
MQTNVGLPELAEGLEGLAIWLRRLAPNTVSTSTMTTLGTLDVFGPLRVSELAAREALTQPGMTVLINRLEASGWAERYADPTDGRAALVRITAEGRRIVAERRAQRRDAVLAALEHLDPDARAALIAALPAIEALAAPFTRSQEDDS